MTEQPAPTSLRPAPEKTRRINVRWLAIGAAGAMVALSTAAALWFRPPTMAGEPQQQRVHVATGADELLASLPSDYSWREEPVQEQPEPPILLQPEPVVRPAAGAPSSPPPPPPEPLPLYYPAGTVHQAAAAVRNAELRQRQALAPGGTAQAAPAPAPVQPAPELRDRQEQFAASVAADARLYHAAVPEEIPVAACVIPAGTRIPAVLTADIDTEIAGSLTAQTSRDVYDITDTCLAVPAGSQLTGTYDHLTAHGQRRVQIAWTILTTPEGKTVSLAGLSASDAQGAAGVGGDVKTHGWSLLGAAILGSLVDAAPAAAGLEANVAVGGVGSQVSSAGQDIIRRELERRPTILVPAGTEITVDVRRHMAMRPEAL